MWGFFIDEDPELTAEERRFIGDEDERKPRADLGGVERDVRGDRPAEDVQNHAGKGRRRAGWPELVEHDDEPSLPARARRFLEQNPRLGGDGDDQWEQDPVEGSFPEAEVMGIHEGEASAQAGGRSQAAGGAGQHRGAQVNADEDGLGEKRYILSGSDTNDQEPVGRGRAEGVDVRLADPVRDGGREKVVEGRV